eukprot:gnl/Dysnectes_brevis/3696_a4726_453.p1 GENE.gnl/Dysnectes_brevis/3696_a4726_453~~gnl/Dysnectes_brevis/3696_a4726_453.p1  ORF type:complete len:867 (+),score=208.51 gnl/Dysnectes_brevis/3696_a4726_453:1462-4062(+)
MARRSGRLASKRKPVLPPKEESESESSQISEDPSSSHVLSPSEPQEESFSDITSSPVKLGIKRRKPPKKHESKRVNEENKDIPTESPIDTFKAILNPIPTPVPTSQPLIRVINATQNNLKNLTVEFPKNRLCVLCGVSGSGKSSLAHHVLHAEAQRQLIEGFSSFARQRLPKFNPPDCDAIQGLVPSVNISQRRIGGTSRSTVGTATEIYTLLRLLYSRCAQPHPGPASMLSFNNYEAACPGCQGTGTAMVLSRSKLIDYSLTIDKGALRHPIFKPGTWTQKSVSSIPGIEDYLDTPLKDWPEDALETMLHCEPVKVPYGSGEFMRTVMGAEIMLQRRIAGKAGQELPASLLCCHEVGPCTACQGTRLRPKSLLAKLGGRSIGELATMELISLSKWLKGEWSRTDLIRDLAVTMLPRLQARVDCLCKLGLGYLSLNRSAPTLSGGEAQRVKLARQLGSSLCGRLFILDEPSIGAHPRDIASLGRLLGELRDGGNTLLMVEHDPALIKLADWVTELGPKAGSSGGNLIFQGTIPQLVTTDTPTGRALSVPVRSPSRVRRAPTGWLNVDNVSKHNIVNLTTRIPLGVLGGIAGVAGSGKSTLMTAVLPQLYPKRLKVVDQGGICGTSRGNPATYTDIFTPIRKAFAKASGKAQGIFSFNSSGACSTCKGLGQIAVEMSFIGTVKQRCRDCEGRRFKPEVLEHKLNGKNIHEVLQMTASDARRWFGPLGQRRVTSILGDMCKAGLGYLTLGQPLNTLSGGEAQRLKLSCALRAKKGAVMLLDEPTTGLHVQDVEKLLALLHALVDAGNTVLVIEHNTEVLASCDWLLEMGPDGGAAGGRVVAQGTPEEVAVGEGATAVYLRETMGLEEE